MIVKITLLILLFSSITSHPLWAMDSESDQTMGKRQSMQEIKKMIEKALLGPLFDIEELKKIKPTLSLLVKPMSVQRRQRLRIQLQDIFSLAMLHNMRLFKGNEEEVFEKYLDDVLGVPVQNAAPQQIHEKTPEMIDKEYHHFLATSYPDLATRYNPLKKTFHDYVSWYNAQSSGPEDRITYNTHKPKFIPGNYGIPNSDVGFWQSWGENLGCTQGWKIHVSAMPHSGKKIAEIVLPIARSPSYLSQGVVGKVMSSIPLMRTLWSLAYINGEETQPGKFIVLYACTTNLAYDLIKNIDDALLEAKQKNILHDSDFQRLIGDANVGHSGGVFVRYGGFTQNKLSILSPSQIDIPHKTNAIAYDNPSLPWPDFMNKEGSYFKSKDESWLNQANPFKDLPLKWHPYGKTTVMTWETRPNSWADLWPKP